MDKKKLVIAIGAGLALGLSSQSIAANPFDTSGMAKPYNVKEAAPIKLARGGSEEGMEEEEAAEEEEMEQHSEEMAEDGEMGENEGAEGLYGDEKRRR